MGDRFPQGTFVLAAMIEYPIFDTFQVKNRRKCRKLLRLRLLYIFREKHNVLRNSYNPLERLIIPAIAFGVVSSLSILNPALSCNSYGMDSDTFLGQGYTA